MPITSFMDVRDPPPMFATPHQSDRDARSKPWTASPTNVKSRVCSPSPYSEEGLDRHLEEIGGNRLEPRVAEDPFEVLLFARARIVRGVAIDAADRLSRFQ